MTDQRSTIWEHDSIRVSAAPRPRRGLVILKVEFCRDGGDLTQALRIPLSPVAAALLAEAIRRATDSLSLEQGKC